MIQILFFLITLSFAHNLKIYVFDVEQCDSQLIVFPSGYSILIDAGEPVYSETATNGPYIAKRIEEILGKKEVDVLVLTHYHIDHHGGYEIGGIWYLVEVAGITFKKFIGRDIGVFSGKTMDECTMKNVEWHKVGFNELNNLKFVCYSTSSVNKTKLSAVREVAEICSTSQINPPDENTEVQIIISDAYGVSDKNGTRLDQNLYRKIGSPNENDYSICLRIQFGDFVYSTCGDLSGNDIYSDTGSYHDVESFIAPMMGEFDLYHSNHHGSKTSTNKVLSDTMIPTVSIISCGDRNETGLPAIATLSNLENVGSMIYLTNNCNKTNVAQFPESTIVYYADVIVTVPKDGTKFIVAKPDGSVHKIYNIKQNKPKRKECAPLV